MVLECYTWIFHLFRRVKGNNNVVDYFSNVPDDLIEDILRRLPEHMIGQCQKVCKKWHMLTSSSHFIGLQLHHINEVKPLTLMHIGYYHPRLFIFDGKIEKECKTRALKQLENAKFVGSCNGLILFVSAIYTCQFFVFNPLSTNGRMTKINAEDTTISRGVFNDAYFHPCGFFFHPLAKDFRILSCLRTGFYNVYYLYLFGAKIWRKTTSNPYFGYAPSRYSCGRPNLYRTPVIVNGGLHWYTSDKIMIFNMFREELSVKSLPFEESYQGGSYLCDLLAEKDQLYFCHVGYQESVMEIWILKDYANWSWTRKYVVDLDLDVTTYPGVMDYQGLSVHSIYKDELILSSKYIGLFSYHLGCNSMNKNVVKVKIDNYDTSRNNLYWSYEAYKP